jgi:predicted metal-dependent hydrolase
MASPELDRPTDPDPSLRDGESLNVARLPDGSLGYVLRRSARARGLRVTIHADRGTVVTVPLARRRGWARPEPLIDRFLSEREPWVRRHLAAMAASRAELAARGGLADGASIRYRGELHRLRVVPGESARTAVTREGGSDRDELVVRLGRRDGRSMAAVLREWFRQRAGASIGEAVDRHAHALGVEPSHVSLRDPRTRWGSASREGRIMFSWRLVLAPPEALDTVVIHELAHLRVFGHGPAFWSLVASRRADHVAWRRWLRSHSLELHAALDG